MQRDFRTRTGSPRYTGFPLGDTYQLNGFAQNRLRFPPSATTPPAPLGVPGRKALSAAEVQNSFHVGALNGARVTWG